MRGEDGISLVLREVTERITPACAGKTPRPSAHERAGADHPRMRGEDIAQHEKYAVAIGSPPHARGRLWWRGWLPAVAGITPACAGKTRT